jgi:hypothetical protein
MQTTTALTTNTDTASAATPLQLEIHFHNAMHETVHIERLSPHVTGDDLVDAGQVHDAIVAAVKKLEWAGYGLWAQHEAVKKGITIFDDIAYQRKNGLQVLDCEDHPCRFRAILVPVNRTEECVVCMEANDGCGLACMHMCCCKKCFAKIDRCPICRKRKGV